MLILPTAALIQVCPRLGTGRRIVSPSSKRTFATEAMSQVQSKPKRQRSFSNSGQVRLTP